MTTSPKGFSSLKQRNRNNLRAVQSQITLDTVISSDAPGLETSATLPDFVLAEFRASAISDRLTLANVRYVEGDEALAEFGLSQNALLSRSSAVKQKARAIENGFWYTYGTTFNGGEGRVICAKPRKPRMGFGSSGSLKKIKYETPAGESATPILPLVDKQTASAVFERYGVAPLENESFWTTVWRCNLPIAITEGVKKALCIIAQGVPAIALRGVACWHIKGCPELHDAIADFATEGRQILIIFDQDLKPSTVRNVGWEITKLGRALEAKGCKVFVPIWDGSTIGKGIDDAIAGMAEADRQDWLDRLLKSAQSFAEWSKVGRRAQLLAMLRRLNTLAIAPERATEGRYLPELPELEQGAIHILDSGMGSGKTTRISEDWVRWAIALGWNVAVVAPMNSLGQQTAEACGLPHIHHFDMASREQIALFETAISTEHGVVLCPDSEHRLPDSFLFGDRPLLLIMDECNQVAEHIANGGTLKLRQGEIMERHAEILKVAASNGAIVLSEAGITPRTVDLVKKLSGCQTDRVFTHKNVDSPKWNVDLYQGSASGFHAALLEAIAAGKKLIVTVASQQAGKRLERLIANQFGNSKAVLRVDSETNEGGAFDEFWRKPNTYLKSQPKLPDVLIISPSGKSGISITVPGFDEVWGYFSCHYPSMWMQQLGRYRLAVPRKVFCPAFINASNGDEALLSPRSIRGRQQSILRGYRLLYGIEQAIESDDEAIKRSTEIQEAFLDFYCDNQAAIGAEKSIACDYLKLLLQEAGHKVAEHKCLQDKEVYTQIQEIKEEIWREEASKIAETTIDKAIHTPKWANDRLNGLDVSKEDRICARKVLWRDEFPGVLFDDADECYEALTLDYGAMRRGVLLQARAMNLKASKAADTDEARALLDRSIVMPHQLPKTHLRAVLIEQTGILSLLDGREYKESDSRVQLVKQKALKWAKEIAYWLRLQIKATQSSIEVCNKLLAKLGLDAVVVRKEGGRDNQVRVWTIDNLFNLTRIKLLKAAITRMNGDSSQVLEQPPDEADAVMSDLADSCSCVFNLETDYEEDQECEPEFIEAPDEGSDE